MSLGLLSSPFWGSVTLGLWWGERLLVEERVWIPHGWGWGHVVSQSVFGGSWVQHPARLTKPVRKGEGLTLENSSCRLHGWSFPHSPRNPGDRDLRGILHLFYS